MKKKALWVAIALVVALAGVAALVTLSRYRGPAGAATGASGGCGEATEEEGVDPAAPAEQTLPFKTQNAVVKGNQAMHAANVKLKDWSQQLDHLDQPALLKEAQAETVSVASFRVLLTSEATSGPDDQDDLEFIDEMVLTAVPKNPTPHLPSVAIAWYYKAEAEQAGPAELRFEVAGDIDLKEYLDGGFDLVVTASGAVPLDDVSFSGDVVFKAR
jgi:hypothetical protein